MVSDQFADARGRFECAELPFLREHMYAKVVDPSDSMATSLENVIGETVLAPRRHLALPEVFGVISGRMPEPMSAEESPDHAVEVDATES